MSFSVSIVTPSFNQGRFVERTIQSVIQQNIPNLEHVVMDGGSTDETLSVLSRYQQHLSWISEPDDGQAAATNKGFQKTSGDIIGWLNSDDVYYPNAIAHVLDFFKAHPEIDIIYGDANLIDINEKLISRYPIEPWNINRLKRTCYISQPAVFFRRRVLVEHGLLDEKLNFCLDYEFWLRLALCGAKWAHIPHVLAGTRMYPETKTAISPLSFNHETVVMLREKLGYVPPEWLINNAMLKVKMNTALRFPGVRFILLVMVIAAYSVISWNGFVRGMVMIFGLPVTGVKLLFYKKRMAILKKMGWAKRSFSTS